VGVSSDRAAATGVPSLTGGVDTPTATDRPTPQRTQRPSALSDWLPHRGHVMKELRTPTASLSLT
jgi:hypothetical protein